METVQGYVPAAFLSDIFVHLHWFRGEEKKNIKANDVIVEQAGFIDLVLVLPCLV